eukprot:CAMPEP_0184409458 /NCGR_PEP_ID=MMETSP0738-20130409/4111_1 /TAXON_ID=385413 /ORGANISM="Thalassiosira miniscula, Strain CCMP1093" /LENGTH=86 /DNA_ID=CAMNT_0026767187 /DNA_START=50 /DNA_END=311 /DNA_ORIENTATION=-
MPLSTLTSAPSTLSTEEAKVIPDVSSTNTAVPSSLLSPMTMPPSSSPPTSPEPTPGIEYYERSPENGPVAALEVESDLSSVSTQLG